MSVTRHHADWLSLVDVSGPFVSLPVLQRVFPQGLEPRDPAQAKALRTAYDEWQGDPTAPGKQIAWVMHVLTAVLGFPAEQILQGQTLPVGLETNMPEMGETLRPDFALVAPTSSETAGQAQLLITRYPAGQNLEKPVVAKHWKATPATRMMELLHGANVPLGLVTNGEHWMLVYAPRGETTGYASWYAALWLDEPITLRAFHSLLGVRRFFGVAANSTLLALFKESATDQQEVTDQLGYQVRAAVEVLVQSFDLLDKESNRVLLKGVEPAELYDCALTVMMRLVFLFSSEERGLLHLGKPLYDDNYAVSTLQEQLQVVADQYGEEVLERRSDAWARLLATFRAVHGGIHHQDLLMQAYGGSLFDPDRYPFLEGRPVGSDWSKTPAEPLAVNNRVVLHLLNSLQRLRTRIGTEGTMETRRVSFRALGVEQIGHVYEGLLDHTAFRASEPVLGIRGTRRKEPEIPLATLELLRAESEDKLIRHLNEETGRSVSALRRDLVEGSLLDEHKLRLACDHNEALLDRLRPFTGIIREDSFERPWVVLHGSIYVTSSNTRRTTGTHYTPPSLTEPIVQHTLEPMVYVGAAEGVPRVQWKLKSPKEILELKVCDMAMGSGAFLVQACRYLAERLVEAWENEEQQHPGLVLITPDGKFSEGLPSERLVPAQTDERMAIARRVVADRCLYGVDINAMAVEMAKLSLWLITMDRSRPFTFIDHAFKCGDSLLGITSVEQLENFSLRPRGGKQQAFATLNLRHQIDEAKGKRNELKAMPSDTPEQTATKAALYAEAEEAVAKLNAAADVLVAIELKGLKGRLYESEREASAEQMIGFWTKGLQELQNYSKQRLGGRHCLHWALAFPEVIDRGGFDSFIGNPPFAGGKKISGALGTDYREYLVSLIANGVKGHADLSAYFFLRAGYLLRRDGMAGLLATNTIAQGDTREVGLDRLLAGDYCIPRAVPSAPWPGTAALEVAHVWLRRGNWLGEFMLNDISVAGITSSLNIPGRMTGQPSRLKSNESKSFIGSYVLGMGFTLTPENAAALIESNSKNKDCLFPFLNGDDLSSRPDQTPSRWAINFFDWPLNRLGEGHWVSANDKKRKEWLRSGIVPIDYPDPVAADYPDLLEIIVKNVKPERTRKNDKGEFQLRYPLYLRWWIYGDKRPELYGTIAGMRRVLAVPLVTKHFAASWCHPKTVFSHALGILAEDSDAIFSVIQSAFHEAWSRSQGSSLETRMRYTPSDCFETFPLPDDYRGLDAVGERYYLHRKFTMQSRLEGITQTYNRLHDQAETSSDIAELRLLHATMDQDVGAAYGWRDLDLGHGFHETRQGTRYTISEAVRREVLDRLLALNHQRHAEEEVLQDVQSNAGPAKPMRKKKDPGSQLAMDL